MLDLMRWYESITGYEDLHKIVVTNPDDAAGGLIKAHMHVGFLL